MKKTGQALDTALVFFAGSQLFGKFRLNSTTLGKITFLYGVARATISWATTSSEKNDKTKKRRVTDVKQARLDGNEENLQEKMQKFKDAKEEIGASEAYWALKQAYSEEELKKRACFQTLIGRCYHQNQLIDSTSKPCNAFAIKCKDLMVYVVREKHVPEFLRELPCIGTNRERDVLVGQPKKVVLHVGGPQQPEKGLHRAIKLALLVKTLHSKGEWTCEALALEVVKVRDLYPCTVQNGQEELGFDREDVVRFWEYAQGCVEQRARFGFDREVGKCKDPNMIAKVLCKWYPQTTDDPGDQRVEIRGGDWRIILGKDLKVTDNPHEYEGCKVFKEVAAKVTLEVKGERSFVSDPCKWGGHHFQLEQEDSNEITDGDIRYIATLTRGLNSYKVVIQHNGLDTPKRRKQYGAFLRKLLVALNDERNVMDVANICIAVHKGYPQLSLGIEGYKSVFQFANAKQTLSLSNLSNSHTGKLSNQDPVSEKFNAFKSELEGKIFPVACKVFLEQVNSVQCVETDQPTVGGDVIEVLTSQPVQNDAYLDVRGQFVLSVWEVLQQKPQLKTRLVCKSDTTDQHIFNNLVRLALGKQRTKFLSPEDVFRVVWDLMAQRKGFDQHSLQTLWEFAKKLNVELFEKQVETQVFNSPEAAYQCLQNHCHYQDGIKASSLIWLGDLCFSSSEDTTKKHSHIHWNGTDWNVSLNNQTWSIREMVKDANQSLKEWWQQAKKAKEPEEHWVKVHYEEKTSPIALMLGMSIVSEEKKLPTNDICARAYKLWTECGKLPTKQKFTNLCNSQGSSKELNNFS